MANEIVKTLTTPKKALKAVLFGTAVVWVYLMLAPLLTGLIGSIMTIPLVEMTLTEAVSAGLTAVLVEYVFANYYPR